MKVTATSLLAGNVRIQYLLMRRNYPQLPAKYKILCQRRPHIWTIQTTSPRRHETLHKPIQEVAKVSIDKIYISAPQELQTIYIIFYMNGTSFLHKKSSNTSFLTSENCTSKRAEKVIKELNTVNSMRFQHRCFLWRQRVQPE